MILCTLPMVKCLKVLGYLQAQDFLVKIGNCLMPHFKHNTFYDGEKSTKMRLSRSSGNFYILGKIRSVQMMYRTSLKLRHMHFISADNFAHPVRSRSSNITHCFHITDLNQNFKYKCFKVAMDNQKFLENLGPGSQLF